MKTIPSDLHMSFPISFKTKKFLVSFFIALPYAFEEHLIHFLNKELDLNLSKNNFVIDGKYYEEANSASGGGEFQVEIFLPKSFSCEKDAIDWFNQEVYKSAVLCVNNFVSMSVIDGEELEKEVKQYEIKTKKREEIAVVEKQLKEKFNKMMKEELLKKFEGDQLAISLINQK